ncbi:hypothetical protein P7C73_g442, partial [Tremellales sp. Uapishka_1]
MNKRPHPSGLPAKPYIPPSHPGPAPPLPAGPVPQYPQQQDPNAHAAAWAAYYQSQGAAAGAAYTAAAQPAQPQPQPQAQPQPAASTSTPNPYANYGYGAGASLSGVKVNTYQPPIAGPSQPYRPPAPQAQNYQYTPQAYNPNPTPQPGYQPQQPRPAGPYQPPQQPNYAAQNWQQPAQPQPPQPQPYRPPYTPTPVNQPYYPQPQPQQPQQPQQQPYTPHQPYRPAAPSPIPQNRPYQQTPPRPPQQQSGPIGFPPAKRPRFDGPGPGMGMGMANGNGNVRPQPGFNSSNGRPPNFSGPGLGRGGAPINGPPLRLGLGPISNVRLGGFGGPPMRGGLAGRGGRMNVPPRGPARRMDDRRVQPKRDDRRDKDRETKKRKGDGGKTTMTDFRIVGIEIASVGWKWGQTGEEVDQADTKKEEEVVKEQEEQVDKAVAAVDGKVEKADGEVEKEMNEAEVEEVEVKVEPEVEEKRGEKRKAKTSSPDPEEEAQAKKRASSYLLTHGKANEAPPPVPSFESNQNRFRIYFESPPELDRVSKSRRNPNKRGRRESSSVAPSRFGEGDEKIDIGEGAGDEADEAGHHQEVVLEESAALDTIPEGEKSAAIPEETIPGETKSEEAVQVSNETPAFEEVGVVTGLDVLPEAVSTISETGTVVAEVEIVVPPSEEKETSQATDGVEAAEIMVQPKGKAPEPADAVEDHELGDVSMVSLPGQELNASADHQEDDLEEVAIPLSSTEPATLPVDPTPTSTEPEIATQPVEKGAEDTKEASEAAVKDVTGKEASAEEVAAALAASAQNTASAYNTRPKSSRRYSSSSVESCDYGPGNNRLSILYEDSSRRLCFDAESVEKVRIFRTEGKIEVVLATMDEDEESFSLPTGILVEKWDTTEQKFTSVTREILDETWTDAEMTIPPFHKAPTEGVTVTVYLNKKKPLSEPKWCRTNQADEWLLEQFGNSKASSETGWKGKLEIMDPDPPPTLQSILEGWAATSTGAPLSERKAFTASLLNDPNNLLEILLRLTRGDRNPLVADTSVRPDSPYASHQTHVSLAILAMYRLTTGYAEKAGEKGMVDEKIKDIIKSLPTGLICKSLDGLFKEWLAGKS